MGTGDKLLSQTFLCPLPLSARAHLHPVLCPAQQRGAGSGRWAVSSAAPAWPLALPQRGLPRVRGGRARWAPLGAWPPEPLHSVCSATCDDRFSLWCEMVGLLVQGLYCLIAGLSCWGTHSVIR